MKNRSWFCYTLDFLGVIALASAACALGGALHLSASPFELLLLNTFKYCLMAGIGALLLARAVELGQILRSAGSHSAVPAIKSSGDVHKLRKEGDLPRAA